MARQNYVILEIGGRGTGKTTRIKEIIEKTDKGKVIIFDTDDNVAFKDFDKIAPELIPRVKKSEKLGKTVVRVIDTDFDNVVNQMQKFWNGLLILEDATKYISGKIPENFANLIIASKQKNVDIILTFHNFRCIHPRLFLLANFLDIFKTGDSLVDCKAKIPKFMEVLEIKHEVENHPSRFYHKSIQIL